MSAQKAEIDLLDIAVSTVRSVIKNLTWVALITVTCTVGGYLTSKFSSAYESQMMIKARRMKDTELSFILLGYQKRGIPGVTKEEAVNVVKNFTVQIHQNNLQPEKKEAEETFASITLKASDSTLFSRVQAAIIDRLNNEKLVKNYEAIDKRISSQIIAEYKDKIRRAEHMMERKPGEETVVLFPEVMNMKTKLAEIEAIAGQPIVTAAGDFQPFQTRLNPITSTIVGTIIGMFLSAVFIGTRAFVSYYKKVTAGT